MTEAKAIIEVAPAHDVRRAVVLTVKHKQEVINIQKRRFEILRWIKGSFDELPP